MIFRKAFKKEIVKVAELYDYIHTIEEKGLIEIGWIRGIYPTLETARNAYMRQDLFVAEDEGQLVAAAIINKQQVDAYQTGNWEFDAPDNEIMVLHTLVVSPDFSGKGYGKGFVDFYEEYALSQKCKFLRMDTNARNINARAMYRKLGYKEIGKVDCDFNGIKGIELILLEKKLPD